MNTEVDLKKNMTPVEVPVTRQPMFWVLVAGLSVMFCLSYLRTIIDLVEIWLETPDYIYGFFVVPFAIFLLWDRRDMLKDVQVRYCLWGIPLILLGILCRCYLIYIYHKYMEAGMLWLTLSGLVLLVGGKQVLKWAWPGIVFLIFMVPMPAFLNHEFRPQLQEICTSGSVFILQVFGVSAIQQGNVIDLPNASPLGVVAACSGMRTLMLFFAACTGAALYVRRHWAIKVVMILSAVPIAIFCNTFRITITALVHMHSEAAGQITHDYAGLIMMPMAIFILWLELVLIEKLFILEEEEHRPLMGEPGLFGIPQERSRDK